MLLLRRWQKEQVENSKAWADYYRQLQLAQAAWVIEQYRIYTMRFGWFTVGNYVRIARCLLYCSILLDRRF